MAEGMLIGGRYDGALLASARRGAFVFVGGNDRQPKGFQQPGKGRWLYRSLGVDVLLVAGVRRRLELWLCAEHTHARCDCGVFQQLAEGERDSRCEMCGSRLMIGSVR